MDFSLKEEEIKDKDYDLNLVERFKNERINEYVQNMARKIVEDFSPKTVLDCGCVDGLLVLELRRLGVESYGVSSSKTIMKGISQEALKYCSFGSIGPNLKGKFLKEYDLIVCIKDFEFLNSLDFKEYILNLGKLSKNILFGLIGQEEKTFGLSLYSALFSRINMFRDVKYSLNFLGDRIYFFSRMQDSELPDVIKDFESVFSKQNKEITKLRAENEELNKKVLKYSHNLVAFKKLSYKFQENALELREFQIQNKVLREIEKEYAKIKNSSSWRVTYPLRIGMTFLRFCWRAFRKIMFVFLKNIQPKNIKRNGIFFLKFGIKATLKQLLTKDKVFDRIVEFRRYFKKVAPTEKEVEFQRKVRFLNNVKISIVVPLYNTPKKYLIDMIESVKGQSYSNWELCLADGSEGEEYRYITEVCLEYIKEDDRIKYKKIEKNLGISENTNVGLKMATGDYIALLDHDDVLSPIALFENVKVINDTGADFIYSDEMTFANDKLGDVNFMHFKPDYSPDTLCTNNYICHFSVFSKELQEKVGFFNSEYDGSQDYDFILRLTENAKRIEHIQKLLYYWRASASSVALDATIKPYCIEAAKKAIKAHLNRLGRKCEVVDGAHFTLYRVRYEIIGNPKISILIPNKDHMIDLDVCITSILRKSTYQNFEILILENNSDFQTKDFYKLLEKKDKRIKVLYCTGGFNYSALNNYGVKYATGDYFLFLNNDTEVITESWIEEMLMYAQRDDVGAVGAKLYFRDDTVQHAGVFLRIGGIGGHGHKFIPRTNLGYAGRAAIVQNVSAVTAACMLISKKAFLAVGGFDEDLRVSFNDVDFCLRLRSAGYLNVFTPHAELYHYESKSRGGADTPQKYVQFAYEIEFMEKRWADVFKKGDPYYNKNLTLADEGFGVRLEDKIS